MKKLFISQPMRGKSDEEILMEREKAIKAAEELVGEPVEVIDSFFRNAPADAKPLWFLGKSLELLAGADVAYFAPGWEETRGCKIEHTCAVEYGMYYQNRSGSRIYLDREPYKMAKKYSLLNYEWGYSQDSYDGHQKMTGKRKSAKRNADIIVSAKSEMDSLH